MPRRILSVLPTLCLIFAVLGGEAPLARAHVLCVVNKSDDTLSIIDTRTNTVIGTVPTGRGPHEVAVDSNGDYAYVTNYFIQDERRGNNSISVIDLETLEPIGKIDLGKNTRPHGIVVSPNGKWLYATAEGNQALVIVDLKKRTVKEVLETGQETSHMVVVTPDESQAFVANIGSHTVTAFDLKNGRVAKQIATPKGPEGIALRPESQELYVANREANNVIVVNTNTLEIEETIAVGDFPIRVVFSRDGQHAFVPNARANTISVIDARERKVVGEISVGKTPIGITVHPRRKILYVANTQDDTVAVVDWKTGEIIDTIQTGDEPDGLALVP